MSLSPFRNNDQAPVAKQRIKPYHLFLFAVLIVSGIICNTQMNEKEQKEKIHWSFVEDQVNVYGYKMESSSTGLPVIGNLKVAFGDELVYRNDESQFYTNNQLLPISRKLKDGRYEFLMGFLAGTESKILLLTGSDKNSLKQDTLPMFAGPHADFDGDGNHEFRGYLTSYPDYCPDCDSVFYNPIQIYEMREAGFIMDKEAMRKWIDDNYSSFHGFKPDRKHVVGRK